MAGVNLREEIMEVAFEQWTESTGTVQVGSNVFPRYRKTVSDNRCGPENHMVRPIPVPVKSREISLNSGGNTDE